MANWRKKGTAALKLLFSAVLIYFVFTKIAFVEVWQALKGAALFPLFLALITFVISKILAAVRLNGYFHQMGVPLTQGSNLRLYLLGMFYNLFLPGGIGGDAYKGYVIKKKYEVATKKVVAVLVLDRLSGLLLLFIYACLLGMLLKQAVAEQYQWLALMAAGIALAVFWFVNRKYFSAVYPVFWRSLGYSALVQLFQLIAVWCIARAIGLESDYSAYLFVFLISSIAAVLPLTIGGVGSREVVFYYGALWLGLDQFNSVGISILFFLITAVVSFCGLFYHFKKPDLELISEIE